MNVAPIGQVGAPPKYPFSKMLIGEEAFFPGARVGGKEYLAAQAVGRNKGWKFSGRTEKRGVRIRRIA